MQDFLEKDQYFSLKEFGLGDSAFTNSNVMVLAYKKLTGCGAILPGRMFFNDLLSKLHSKVEDTVGIFKGCFPYFWNLHVKLKVGKHLMRCMTRYSKSCAILSDLFVDHSIPEDWLEAEDDTEDVEEGNDALREVIPENNQCNQVHNYLDMKINEQLLVCKVMLES